MFPSNWKSIKGLSELKCCWKRGSFGAEHVENTQKSRQKSKTNERVFCKFRFFSELIFLFRSFRPEIGGLLGLSAYIIHYQKRPPLAISAFSISLFFFSWTFFMYKSLLTLRTLLALSFPLLHAETSKFYGTWVYLKLPITHGDRFFSSIVLSNSSVSVTISIKS